MIANDRPAEATSGASLAATASTRAVRRRALLLHILTDAGLVLGGALGLGLAWLVISHGDPTSGLLPMFFFPTRDLLIGFGISVALGFVTGIFPALQAMRLRVADALRRM